jgi:integrase
MASLQARHSRACAAREGGKPWTPFESLNGCICKDGPTYYVVVRDGRRNHADRIGKNRRTAKRALDKINVQVDEGTYVAPRVLTFEKWVEEWYAGLRRPKPNTLRSYRSTIDYAVEAFGHRKLRELRVADVQRFLELMEGRSPATQLKHLRVLHACLGVAVRRGLTGRNVVDELEASERPPAPRKLPSYFTDDELTRLWPELAQFAPVYDYLHRVALTTGCRQGELLALDWSDVKLLERELAVERTYVAGIGVQTPKGNRGRTVDLTPAALGALEAWCAISGSPESGLVFPSPDGGYLSPTTITRRVLYKAMRAAGIPREGEHGRKRDFHSTRHSFARIALQNGARIDWVQRQLGHSSITLTVDRYGRWERKAEKAEAEKLEGAFPVGARAVLAPAQEQAFSMEQRISRPIEGETP